MGASLRRVRHADLSGYKVDSAARIWVEATGGGSFTLVFKRVFTTETAYPATKGFPGRPGRPERALYERGPGALLPYMPRLLEMRERAGERQIDYYFEDLTADHRKAVGEKDLMRTAAHLLALQEPMRTRYEEAPDDMIRYDGTFGEEFLEYARDALTDFVESTDDATVREFLDRWPDVEQAYLEATPAQALHAVHGDFRSDNLFLHRTSSDRFKLVDWEFAGWGWLHNDLVSMLKGVPERIAREVLQFVFRESGELTLRQHERLFERCRLERGILDAALVVRQRMATMEEPYVNADHFAEALDAMGRLASAGRP